ncbi:hypothetical protein LJR099_003939 [Variovorax paradoxus]
MQIVATWVCAVVMGVAAGGVRAQNAVIGVGVDSCVKWLAAREHKDRSAQAMYLSWVQGNLTGRLEDAVMNRPPETLGRLTLPDYNELQLAMDATCRKNSNQPLFVATSSIWSSMLKRAGVPWLPQAK